MRSLPFLLASRCLVMVPRAITSFIPSYARVSASASSPHKRLQWIPQTTTTTSTAKRAVTTTSRFATPEPGACPECGDETTYWDGSTLFVCTACAHEWAVDAAAADDAEGGDGEDEGDDGVTRDVNGNSMEQGDTCVLIKDLAKGKLKKGLKVKIRLGDYGDGHDCEATIPKLGTYALKSEFLKKA